jgi:hypothetical protein
MEERKERKKKRKRRDELPENGNQGKETKSGRNRKMILKTEVHKRIWSIALGSYQSS